MQGEDLDEFTDLRYTPVFCEQPNFFRDDGYSLWCNDKRRHIELIIVVTVYNEDNLELEGTLRGLSANLEVRSTMTHEIHSRHVSTWCNDLAHVAAGARAALWGGFLEACAGLHSCRWPRQSIAQSSSLRVFFGPVRSGMLSLSRAPTVLGMVLIRCVHAGVAGKVPVSKR